MKINELLKRSTPFRSCFAAALPASIILILGANHFASLAAARAAAASRLDRSTASCRAASSEAKAASWAL